MNLQVHPTEAMNRGVRPHPSEISSYLRACLQRFSEQDRLPRAEFCSPAGGFGEASGIDIGDNPPLRPYPYVRTVPATIPASNNGSSPALPHPAWHPMGHPMETVSPPRRLRRRAAGRPAPGVESGLGSGRGGGEVRGPLRNRLSRAPSRRPALPSGIRSAHLHPAR